MTTINWTISQLDCKPQEDGLTDVVVTAHWQCTGTQDEYSAQVYGTASFTLEQGAGFTPYADLTQDQVLGWCWNSGVDKDATEENLNNQIANLVNPPVVVLPLPWAQPAEA
jgi:hypothetical protein